MPSEASIMISGTRYPSPWKPRAQSGLSMIELMISLVIGLIITAAVGSVFLSGGKNYRDNDRFARMQETGRFAIEMIGNDLAMASFWGRLVVYPNIANTLGTATSCNVTHAPKRSLTVINQATAANAAPYCIDTTTFLDKTGIVAIKFMNGIPISGTQEMGKAYLRSGGNSGKLFLYDGTPPTSTEIDWEYISRVYYIRNTPDPNNGSRTIPVLARKYLAGASMDNDETLLDGVEDLQVDIGINTDPAAHGSSLTGDTDTIPAYYTSAPSATELIYAVTAKIYILVRSPEPDLSPVNKTYLLGSKSISKNDNYRRKVFTTTVLLRNTFYQLRNNGIANL